MTLDSIVFRLVCSDFKEGYPTARQVSDPVTVLAGNLPTPVKEWLESNFMKDAP